MENRVSPTHHVLYGESAADVADYLKRTPKQWVNGNTARGNLSQGTSWDLGANWEATTRMAAQGWSEGTNRLATALNVLMPPNAKETETRYDVAGHFPDVARFVAGDPACMVRRGRTGGHTPVVSIVVGLTAHGGIPASYYANFGAALVNVIDQMEASGQRVELSIMFPNALPGIRCLAGWRVKAAEDHCDLSSIAFSLAHPAAYRRLGFGLWEMTANRHYPGSGYGRCVSFTKADAEYMGLEEPLIIDAEGNNLSACSTPALAATFVASRINAAAGEIIVELPK